MPAFSATLPSMRAGRGVLVVLGVGCAFLLGRFSVQEPERRPADAVSELAALRAENERLRERVRRGPPEALATPTAEAPAGPTTPTAPRQPVLAPGGRPGVSPAAAKARKAEQVERARLNKGFEMQAFDARLLERARTQARSRTAFDRYQALEILMQAAPAEALEHLRRLLGEGTEEERTWAVGALSRARHRAFKPLLEETVHDASIPAGTRKQLIRALAALKGKHWATIQMTGAPDTPLGGDMQTAWASKAGDMGEVWVELDFAHAVTPDDVRVHETYNPGAIVAVMAKSPTGAWKTIWRGSAPLQQAPAWFEPPVDAVAFRTRTIKLVLDTNRVAGWNEIDAVELVGDGTRQWAQAARASSSYAGE